MRNASTLVYLAAGVAAITGCAAEKPTAASPVESPRNTSTSSQEAPESALETTGVSESPAPSSGAALGRISAALESIGVESLSSDADYLWKPDLSGAWREGRVFAWAVDPDAIHQVVEVHGSAELQGTHGNVTALVYGPELSLVRLPCRDLVVDVAAGVNVEQGTSDEALAIELARDLYPALGC